MVNLGLTAIKGFATACFTVGQLGVIAFIKEEC